MPDTEPPVVVGIDGSEDALRALDWAVDEASRHDWAVRLVHAYQRPTAMMPAITVELPAPLDEARRMLDEARVRALSRRPGVPVSMVHEEGRAPDVLLRAGERARLLVLGREGRGRIAELTLGSVSVAVAARASAPVAVVPGGWEPPETPYGRIVAGVDGSPNCRAAVRHALRAAAERNAELLIVFAWDPPVQWPGGDTGRHVEARFAEVLSAAVGKLPEEFPGVQVTAAVEIAKPAEALRRRAAEADLVVIGGRGHGAVTGMLLGSVARSVIRHLDRPVVVVHQAGGRAAAT